MSTQQPRPPGEHYGLIGRCALVTGAAGGIGQAIVSAMLEAGVRVLATDREHDRLERLRALSGSGSNLILTTADLSCDNEPMRLVQSAIDAFGRLDILINNAGCIIRHKIADTSTSDWDLMMSVNLKAAFFLAQQAAGSMSEAGWGRIVNLTSQAGHTGGAADCPVYAITKGALMTMTRALARSLAPAGVTVNAVAPGIVMTDMISGTLSQSRINELVEQIPVKRVSTAGEIADAVMFLASERAGSITGHVLDINGGMVMR